MIFFKLDDYALPAIGDHLYDYHAHCEGGRADYKPRLWISRNNKGVTFFCHNCGQSQFIFIENNQRVKQVVKDSLAAEKALQLPEDLTEDFPKEALLFLYKYNLTTDEITNNGLLWSRKLNRLVFPIYHEGKMIYWQARDVSGEHFKWLTPKGVKKPLHTVPSQNGRCDAVIIVEDIISAIKVSRIADVICLFGTFLSKEARLEASNYEIIHIWLDNDAQDKAKKMQEQIELMHTNCQVIVTPHDPKTYTTEEIGAQIP